MKIIRILVCLLMFAGLFTSVRAEEQTSIHAILVAASNNKGPSDRRLAAYEPTLRSILRFESYRFLGEGSAKLPVPAQGNISIGQGHHLDVATEPSGDGAVRIKVSWMDGGRVLMRTVISQRPGVPTVLGGPASGKGEVYAVIVICR